VRTYSEALELALQDSPFLFVIPTLLIEILVVALVPQRNRLRVQVHDSRLLVQVLGVTGNETRLYITFHYRTVSA
jgi:hypothetical protein